MAAAPLKARCESLAAGFVTGEIDAGAVAA